MGIRIKLRCCLYTCLFNVMMDWCPKCRESIDWWFAGSLPETCYGEADFDNIPYMQKSYAATIANITWHGRTWKQARYMTKQEQR